MKDVVNMFSVLLCGVRPNGYTAARQLSTSRSWVCSTPLGMPVVPDVSTMAARSCPASAIGSKSSG